MIEKFLEVGFFSSLEHCDVRSVSQRGSDAREMGRGQGTKDRKKRGDAKRAGEPAQSSPVVPLLSITIGILACALVYLNLDALGLGAVQSSTTPGPTESGASSTSSHAVGSDERRENSPDPCVKLRQAANNHFRAGRIQHGLEQLMKCAELSPTARCGTFLAHYPVAVPNCALDKPVDTNRSHVFFIAP